MPMHREIKNRRGEGAIVKAHSPDVTHRGGRHAVGRREQRNNCAKAEATSGLLSCTHDPERCALLGGVTMPLGQDAATVKPLCGGSGWVVRNAMVPGRWAMTSGSVPVAPCGPV